MGKQASIVLLMVRSLIMAGVALASSAGLGHAADDTATLSVERIEMTPTRDGFYDAIVALVVRDPRISKEGKVVFTISVAHVHDVDEAFDKVHEPIENLSDDLHRGYFDLHREP